jgi:glycosyltransferase involved in cell wall biosynthesis
MIRVLTTYYNSPRYILKCLDSLKMQSVKDWVCYITNDCSTDGSAEYVKFLIKDDNRFVLINNTEKMWQTGNYYQVVHRPEINDTDICVTLDGDDWLSDGEVFKRVYSYYNNSSTLMTFGQFMIYKGGHLPLEMGFTRQPNPICDVRKLAWTSSHLRTFKAGLFRKVKKHDLLEIGRAHV